MRKHPVATHNRCTARTPMRKINPIHHEPVLFPSPPPKSRPRQSTARLQKKPIVVDHFECFQIDNPPVPTRETTHAFIKFKPPKPIKNKAPLTLIPLTNTSSFIDALAIYENNQSYYLNYIEEHGITSDVMNEVTMLEKWFSSIHEPRPKNMDDILAWEKRQAFQKERGYSAYFDSDLLYYYH